MERSTADVEKQTRPIQTVPTALLPQECRTRTDMHLSLLAPRPRLAPATPTPRLPLAPPAEQKLHFLRSGIPTNDMAIGIVLFNFTRSERVHTNYLTMRKKLNKFPVFTLELVLNGQEPRIPDAIVVRTSSWMFHKERLCRILETHIPADYTKICFVDADILFGDPFWYSNVSLKLNAYHAVQPFEEAIWLEPDNHRITNRLESSGKHGATEPFHPGFAWAFQRNWYCKYGYYDYAITGGGDAVSVAAWFRIQLTREICEFPTYKDFFERVGSVRHRVSYVPGKVFHLWHGFPQNRQYRSRHTILRDVKDVRDIVRQNSDGVYELTDARIGTELRTYFENRDDDGKKYQYDYPSDDRVRLPSILRPYPWSRYAPT